MLKIFVCQLRNPICCRPCYCMFPAKCPPGVMSEDVLDDFVAEIRSLNFSKEATSTDPAEAWNETKNLSEFTSAFARQPSIGKK